MNELLRLDYLEAMGITQYVARMPLPGACPSQVIHVETEQSISVTALFDDEDFSITKKSSTLPTSTPSNPTSVAATASNATTSTPATFQCQIAIWTVNDLLILADAPRLDNQQLTLLRNILHAIGRKDNLSDTRQFAWPLQQRKEKSLAAAQEHFQGLLDGGLLKTNGLRQILCFGDTVNALLHTTDFVSEKSTPEKHVQQYQDWPITHVCALHEMLSQPTRKADTWRTLQALIRS